MDKGIRNTVAILIAVVVTIFGLQFWNTSNQSGLDLEELKKLNTYIFNQPRTVPEFLLQDHNGQSFSAQTLKTGEWSLINFGYTFCPDVCPTTLLQLNTMVQQMEEQQMATPRVFMFSVDPPRDTPERLKEYLAFFNPDFTGVTGEVQTLSALAQSMNNVFIKAPGGTEEAYFVDHSVNLAIINPAGKYVGFIKAPHKPSIMARAMSMVMNSSEAN